MGVQRTAAYDEPPQAELLHQSERTRVARLTFPAGSVIRKEPLGPEAARRLRHEFEMLEMLAGVEGVVQLAVRVPPAAGSVLLTDVGGVALVGRSMPLEPDALVDLAASLAGAVAGMHQRGVVHRDINPANVVVGGPRSGPILIDFALATTFTTVQPGFVPCSEIVGTCPYLAPEQTGRTGRQIDQRADLYALGATFYELATGSPPFGTGDPLRIVHDHLARVPAPPASVNPAVPADLSAIIMKLLEKEPDDRYQSADGLAHDLALVGRGEPVRPGEHDLSPRALTPSRLCGREAEIGELGTAFAAAMAGRRTGVLVSGVPGVGKTSLVNELRPIVAGVDGWFVAGKFDQYRRDQEYDGLWQAFRALGRLLLAEPESYLAEVRERLLGVLGPGAGLVAFAVPELAALLRIPPEPGDPLTARDRALYSGVEILRAVASRKRPVVLFVDDLQWAGRTSLGFIDLILGGGERVDGLLLVAAYRDSELEATHPLTPMLAQWHRKADGPNDLRLANLRPDDQAAMVADLLRLALAPAGDLARLIAPSSRGNPYDTVELLGSLRQSGALSRGDRGWRWDEAALRRQLARVDMTELLSARVAALPVTTRDILTVMACLAGRVDLDLLEAATGLAADEVSRRLAPASTAGLLVLESDARPSARFHHDRTREAVLSFLTAAARHAEQLRLARRLAGRDEFFAVAAEQYLVVTDAVRSAAERRLTVGLFRRAADQARMLANYSLAERFLTAAVPLIDPADADQLTAVHAELHAALYSLGRLEEADRQYLIIDRLCTQPAERTAVTAVQIRSLTSRGRVDEAMRLGLDQLVQLGVAIPDRDHLDAEIDRGLDVIYRWIDQTSESDDLCRPATTDPSRLGAVKLIGRMLAAGFYCDRPMMIWLIVEMLQMWARDGPDRSLVGPACHAMFVTFTRRRDYRTGHRIIRRILAVATARGFEPEMWDAQYLCAMGAGHWCDPLEDILPAARRALEGLIRDGVMDDACGTHCALVFGLLDCAPSLDVFGAEVDEALALAARTGNSSAEQTFRQYHWLTDVLRGAADASEAEEKTQRSVLAANPFATAHLHTTRALVAAILDHPAELARHTAALMPLLPFLNMSYSEAVARFLRALSLASEARAARTGECEATMAELDETIGWLTGRAAESPANFGHMLRLVEAERAWAAGDFRDAAYAFDLAQHEASLRTRPWHHALILERSARFYLTNGMQRVGDMLLAAARSRYVEWGATVKVRQLDWANPTLRAQPAGAQPSARPTGPAAPRSTVTTGTIDLLGIVAASQALSSETNVGRLRDRVQGVLSAMTGATGVHLLLRDNEQRDWSVLAGDSATVSLAEASRQRLLPPSVIWYAERTHEPLVIIDACQDDRFNRDPYCLNLGRCSLLAIPIMIRGERRAMLLLENRMIRGAFTTERLEGIMLVAGQLAVSLDNAMVYASLERKVAERTQQLAAANQRLEQLSVTDQLTGLANRRRLDEALQAEWQRAMRQKSPLAIAMIDIDLFKLYNDHFGHTAGDRCLHRVATCLAASSRTADLTARYGGEEFAAVMPDTDIDAAARLAERLRSAIEKLDEPHSPVAHRVVTVSIGVASNTPAPGSDPTALVELADTALYRAKNRGRNRVETAPAAGLVRDRCPPGEVIIRPDG
ncbi:diguanylate cyclase [Frankia sp. AgB1.9]|uniref:diguanylate cyclase n=1 Tax=unclassified Frankia TaxID=2632575 RepID=UPI0019342CD2|nr:MULTISPECIES: diguanylate cyclase [unclassified Frankia]MBL7489774.1 diguanylate cyclase [Frankia sp. AgW1.1]MBL7552623.1 diguanylate cyclase [Frankia sp. AgB1.9]MBL7623711.1 diguanylate cyclase [Frankia sp. AgB1.8]